MCKEGAVPCGPCFLHFPSVTRRSRSYHTTGTVGPLVQIVRGSIRWAHGTTERMENAIHHIEKCSTAAWSHCPPPWLVWHQQVSRERRQCAQVGNGWILKDLQVVCGTMGMPTATVKLKGPDGSVTVTSAVGVGPVDAAYKAVDSVVDVHGMLEDYAVTSVTAGIDSVATTRVRLSLMSQGLAAVFGSSRKSAVANLRKQTSAHTNHGHRQHLCHGCRVTVCFLSVIWERLALHSVIPRVT
jgi:hypothetical protein